MTEFSLTVNPREVTGKGHMRKLRRAGLVPGVIYGIDDPLIVQFDGHTAQGLVHSLHGGERLIELRIEGGDGKQAGEKRVLVKDVQTTPVGAKLLHIDFYEVDVSQTVHVAVEVRAEGRASGEIQGGILQQVTREVAVECLPTVIPEYLSADVEALEIGMSLHMSDIVMPEGVKPITPAEETIFVMAAPRVEEEVEEEIEGEEGLVEGEEGEEGEEAPAEESGEESPKE